MYDSKYFLGGLKKQVEQMGGDVIVTLVLHSGGTFYVRDVVETHSGYVLLNVWHDSKGRPMKAPSSDVFNMEVPSGYHSISVSFESISMIDIIPTNAEERKRIGFIPNSDND
jgi:hypothetical protein